MNKSKRVFKTILLAILNATWCILQNIAGIFVLVVFLILSPYAKLRKYRGMICIYHRFNINFTLGAFAFTSNTSDSADVAYKHCYGHFIQSCIWGPLYLFVIMIPLAINRRKKIITKRAEFCLTYQDLWQEKSARRLAKKFGEE